MYSDVPPPAALDLVCVEWHPISASYHVYVYGLDSVPCLSLALKLGKVSPADLRNITDRQTDILVSINVLTLGQVRLVAR